MDKAAPHELLALADIADLFGVQASVVSNWRSRQADFPAPFATVARGHTPLWHRADIEAWIRVRYAGLAQFLTTTQP